MLCVLVGVGVRSLLGCLGFLHASWLKRGKDVKLMVGLICAQQAESSQATESALSPSVSVSR